MVTDTIININSKSNAKCIFEPKWLLILLLILIVRVMQHVRSETIIRKPPFKKLRHSTGPQSADPPLSPAIEPTRRNKKLPVSGGFGQHFLFGSLTVFLKLCFKISDISFKLYLFRTLSIFNCYVLFFKT